MKKGSRKIFIDIGLNIVVPYAIYMFSHKTLGLSDINSLILSSAYPILDIIVEYTIDHTLNFISVIVLIGTVTGIFGALLAGNPKLILLRESFFTFFLGISCFITLVTGKPLMFYFAREFVAGKDPVKRREFSLVLQNKTAYTLFRILTVVWGVVYVLEFGLKLFIIYAFPVSTILLIAPISSYAVTFSTIFWTFWYVNKRRNASHN